MNDPAAAFRAMIGQLALTTTPDTRIIWADLSEDAAARALRDLTRWVDWLVGRYHLDPRVIPPCWAEHGEHVEELSALRAAWHAIYTPTRTGEDALRWHADFALARERLTDWTARTGCRQGHHRPPHA